MSDPMSDYLKAKYAYQKPTPVKALLNGSAKWVVVKHGLDGKNDHGHGRSYPYAAINAEEYKRYPFDLRLVTWYKTIDEATRGVTFCDDGATRPVQGPHGRRIEEGVWDQEGDGQR